MVPISPKRPHLWSLKFGNLNRSEKQTLSGGATPPRSPSKRHIFSYSKMEWSRSKMHPEGGILYILATLPLRILGSIVGPKKVVEFFPSPFFVSPFFSFPALILLGGETGWFVSAQGEKGRKGGPRAIFSACLHFFDEFVKQVSFPIVLHQV